MELSDAQRAVDDLARWHGEFWGDADRLVGTGAAVSLADPIYLAVLPIVFAEGWEEIDNSMDVHPAFSRVAPRWAEAMPSMSTALSTSPTTVCPWMKRARLWDDDRVASLFCLVPDRRIAWNGLR